MSSNSSIEIEQYLIVDSDQEDQQLITPRSWEPQFQNSHSSISLLKTTIQSKIKKFNSFHIAPNIGIICLLSGELFNSTMFLATKLLQNEANDKGETMNPLQILFVRMSITFLFSLGYMYLQKFENFPFGPRKYRKILIIRGITASISVTGTYYALKNLYISDVTVISFITPCLTGLMAWCFLKEGFSLVEFGSGLVSFIGVIFVAKPSFLFGKYTSPVDDAGETNDPVVRYLSIIAMLMSSFLLAVNVVILRHMGQNVHAVTIISYFAFTTVIISFLSLTFIPSMSFMLPQSSSQWMMLFWLGSTGFLMQICFTVGVQNETATRSSLMAYTQIIFAVFWDFAIWGHIPNSLSWFGFILIIASTILMIYFKPVPAAEIPVLVDVEYGLEQLGGRTKSHKKAVGIDVHVSS